MFSEHLQKLGLNKGEALLYSTLLQHGECSATQISKYSGLGRTNVYDYATSLQRLGLISELERNKKTYYKAESPVLLQQLAEARFQEAKQVSSDVAALLPRLESAYHKSSLFGGVEFFSGYDGRSRLFDKLFLHSEAQELYLLLPDLDDYLPAEPRQRLALHKRGVQSFLLANHGSKIREFQLRDDKENRTTLLVSPSRLEIVSDLIVLGDAVVSGALHSERNFQATLLHDSLLAKQLQRLCGYIFHVEAEV